MPPSQSEAEEALIELLARRAARSTMNGFVHYTMPTVQDAWYHPVVDSYLDRLVRGEIKRLMLLMPPRHGKSERVSRRLPAFYLGNNPDHEIIACSHTMALIGRMSGDVKRVMESPAYSRLFPDVRLPSRSGSERNTTEFWQVAGRLGSYRAGGVGAGITGQGFHLGIIDDITKGYEQASSQTWRDKTWHWYGGDFYTRQAPDAKILITATPWDRDDLMGRLQELQIQDENADQWTVVRFPALYDDRPGPYDLRFELDCPLWEDRFNRKTLSSIQSTLGTQMFTALYQCRPDAAGGNRFREEWLMAYEDAGDRWIVNGIGYLKTTCTIYVAVDPASSEKKSADYTAMGVFAVTPKNDMLILDMVNEQMGAEAIPRRLKILSDKWSPAFIIFEVNGFQTTVAKGAQQIPGMPPISHVTAFQSKIVRAYPAMVACEQRQIHIPRQGPQFEPQPWLRPLVQQLIQFRGVGDETDDMVDTVSYAILKKNSLGMRKDVAAVGIAPEPVEYAQPVMPDDWTAGAHRLLPS